MAWQCSGRSNTELIENMWRRGLITDKAVKEAFLKVRISVCPGESLLTSQVDRAHYAPSSPYEDSPQAIGHAATISAPHMHASAVEHVLQYLLPTSPRRVLDVGSGSGYLTQVLAEVIGEQGKVVGVEHITALKELGEGNMRKSERGRELLASGRVQFVVGDGRKGWDDGEGGWDVIHVGASAREVHEPLIVQLKAPGW